MDPFTTFDRFPTLRLASTTATTTFLYLDLRLPVFFPYQLFPAMGTSIESMERTGKAIYQDITLTVGPGGTMGSSYGQGLLVLLAVL
jgi:hypothetical protein